MCSEEAVIMVLIRNRLQRPVGELEQTYRCLRPEVIIYTLLTAKSVGK